MSEIDKAPRVSPFWLGAGVLLAFLALWAIQGFAGEAALSREIAVHGQDLAGELAGPVDEMKQQLASWGCTQFSLAYWSVETATRLRVEVRCRRWMKDVPFDGDRPVGVAAGGPPR